MKILDLPVEPREKLGSANSRRYRLAGQIPTILYGRGKDNVPLTVSAVDFAAIQAAHTLLIRLKTGDKEQIALIREISWDVFGEYVQHVDLTQLQSTPTLRREEITTICATNVRIAIHSRSKAKGNA